MITKESKHNQNPSNRNRKWRNFIISFLIIFITFLTTAAFTVEEESLGDNEVSQRIEFVQLHLEKGSQHAKYWYYGWLGFFSLGNITQLGVYTTTEDNKDKFDAGVGLIKTTLGVFSMLTNPIVAHTAAEKLSSLPERTLEERKVKLLKAEMLLHSTARREKQETSLFSHVFIAVLNILGGLAIANDTGDHRETPKQDGAINASMGILTGELKTITAPTQAIDDWNEYTQKHHAVPRKVSYLNTKARFYTFAHPGGLGVGLRFSF